jgi:hypothetical protein
VEVDGRDAGRRGGAPTCGEPALVEGLTGSGTRGWTVFQLSSTPWVLEAVRSDLCGSIRQGRCLTWSFPVPGAANVGRNEPGWRAAELDGCHCSCSRTPSVPPPLLDRSLAGPAAAATYTTRKDLRTNMLILCASSCLGPCTPACSGVRGHHNPAASSPGFPRSSRTSRGRTLSSGQSQRLRRLRRWLVGGARQERVSGTGGARRRRRRGQGSMSGARAFIYRRPFCKFKNFATVSNSTDSDCSASCQRLLKFLRSVLFCELIDTEFGVAGTTRARASLPSPPLLHPSLGGCEISTLK